MNHREKEDRQTPVRQMTVLTVLLILLISAVRIFSASVHPTSIQHDRLHHHQFIRALVVGSYERNYEGPYYYLIAAGMSVAVRELQELSLFPQSSRSFISYGIVGANLLLFAFFIAGILKLGKLFKLSFPGYLLLFAFSASFPVIHRSFNMARPENLMLVLTVWAFYFLLSELLSDEGDKNLWRNRIAFIILLAFCVTQKVTGLIVLAATLAVILTVSKRSAGERLKLIATSAILTLILSTALWFTQYQLSGSVFFQHRESCGSNCGPETLSVFYRFNPLKVWNRPFRNSHKDSMLNILYVDLYGDYWRYGIDAPIYSAKRWFRYLRVRTGIVVSTIFFLLLAGGICCYLKGNLKLALKQKRLPPMIALSIVPFAGYLFLILASFTTPYGKHKFDLIKWEYILWGLPFIAFPVVSFYEQQKHPLVRAAIYSLSVIVITGGLIQSLPLYEKWLLAIL